MKLDSKVYDILSWIGKIVLPALAVLWVALGDVWGFPYKNEIATTITAIDVFLNSLLGISSANYYKDEAKADEVVDKNEAQG